MRFRSPLTSTLSLVLPRQSVAQKGVLHVGFLAPLSGPLKSWGEPGYHGCIIWKEWLNARGGLKVGDRHYAVDIIPFDTEFNHEKALEGARRLYVDHDIQLLIMLGARDFSRPLRDFINERKSLVTTLFPSDLSPDARTLLAPCEVHPIYNVTGVSWLARSDPSLQTYALCTQNDAQTLPSIATYRAAFEAEGIRCVGERFFPVETTDFSSIVADLLARKPDILCLDTAYTPFVHAITIEAFRHGFTGRIISCTCDDYPELVRKTSPEFMSRFVFQFPDFDDPLLAAPRINFADPRRFYEEFCRRFPGTWSAVSWEYASILEMWKSAVVRARTCDPQTVLAMMKVGGRGKHVFGEAHWWGRELFGVDNALVGDWPVVVIRDGRARIVEFGSTLDWWERNGPILIRHMRALGLMWDQREQRLVSSR
ncbi:ABC transporter substrate-binding protein [Hyphomicrobium sp.]|uniref:ABC transporter substrate-binding protein n=1 Tax=Hyphomicrobium sp. TaxID=82 RepID=UPI002FDE83EE